MDASTFTSAINYNRIDSIKESVHSFLRDEIRKQNQNPDWSTEVVTTELFTYSNRRCEDRLLVTMSVKAVNELKQQKQKSKSIIKNKT